MAFDQATRNLLQHFVSDARKLLTEEFTRQLQNDFGLDPKTGAIQPLESLAHLDDGRRETARLLREMTAHYQATSPSGGAAAVLDRIVREQAFTVLNRLVALRMAETRDILIESVSNGYQSKGFQLYSRLAGSGLGETGDAYRCYLFSVFDELALDLAVLFDRFSPQGRLFPREVALKGLLELLNDPELSGIWAEDEAIGWVYQYFNSKEERKKMRDESAAPRNSRELAVRNQFFTPRYVVEFLTDNTLGRTWYEMTQGTTRLADSCQYLVRRPVEVFLNEGASAPTAPEAEGELSQEELLKQPVYIPFRALKDPREILMLDPACGSMHFGLYAFDLYEAIYAEAWEIEEQDKTFVRTDPTLKSLHETYDNDREAFVRDVPRLILERNIHGVDIDPRAVQIAGLSLWLRAQRAWQDQGVKPSERPQIRRSNIVCAEPMPGEEAFLKEFLDKHLSETAELRLLGQLVRRVFEAMKLAGEAGTLLKIEEEIAGDIAEAKKKWHEGRKAAVQERLFDVVPTLPQHQSLDLDVSGITDAKFWEQAEERIYTALRQYAESADATSSYQRRLFADDAARGFAFIDLCRKRFDVALMNPPFGQASAASSALIKILFKKAAFDLFACFLERGLNLLVPSGSLGAITTSAGFYRNQIEDWRTSFFLDGSARACADLGGHVLDGATVRAAAYIRDAVPSIGRSVFIRCNEVEAKDQFLLQSLLEVSDGSTSSRTFLVDTRRLNELPGRPLAYWLPAKFQQEISKLKRFADSKGDAQFGLSTKDDFRFIRLAWEVPETLVGQKKRWCFTSKGGTYSPFYYDIHLVVLHESNFQMLEQSILVKYPYLGDNASWVLHRENNYYQPGITFQRRTNKPLSPRVLPSGCLFTDNGPSAFWENYPLFTFLALFNSSAVKLLAAVGNGALEAEGGGGANSYEVGVIKNIVVPVLTDEITSNLENIAKRIIELKRTLDISRPETRVFTSVFRKEHSLYLSSKESIDMEIGLLTNKIDGIVNPLYGFTEGEISSLLSSIAPDEDSGDDDVELSSNEDEPVKSHDSVSWLTGCVLSRWEIRYATGELLVPDLSDPFSPLSACPPGMLQNAAGLPAEPSDVPDTYPLRITWSGILVDDKGHLEDIEARVQDALTVIWPDNHEAIEQEACEILGVKTLRDYFRKPAGFFADHLKRYSKSRRQAPIYWPLSTEKGSYTLWLYYHHLTDQTLFTCINDFVQPKLDDTEAAADALRNKSGRSRDEEKELERLQDLEAELRTFKADLLRLAPLWKPNLNDGVQITAAPLWKLFRLPKWQKTLKETWDKLEKGDYDWAHLAYSLWPERVQAKCKTDKSLAIAHDREDLYEAPPATEKKTRGRKAKAAEITMDMDEEGGDE